MIPITIEVGTRRAGATLDDSVAGRDFAGMLPLELAFSDFHGIEKIADLPRKVDTSKAAESYAPQAGDITFYAPWGNLAIFYKPFQRARGLVRLGAFNAPIGSLFATESGTIRVLRSG